jgi:predicted AAA+ superfamily ATPase
VFEKNLDPVRILRELSVDRAAPIEPGKTLLFIDEIQACTPAITALRYFYEEIPNLHVIGAGSLLEFAIEEIGLPVGRVQTLTMYPLSFAEYLAASGNGLLLEAICEKTNFSPPIHQKAIDLLGEYFVIGGLPEVVANWIAEKQPLSARDKLTTIVNSYRQDFEKYAKKHSSNTSMYCFSTFPCSLGKSSNTKALLATEKENLHRV